MFQKLFHPQLVGRVFECFQNEIILNEPKSADTPKEGKHRSSEVNGKDLGSDEEGSEEVDSDDFEMLESDDDEEEQNIDDLSVRDGKNKTL